MAAKKKKKTKYARSSKRDVESEMRRHKKGTAKSGRGGKGGKVKSKKQVIDIGLSKARNKGKRVPKEVLFSSGGSTAMSADRFKTLQRKPLIEKALSAANP